MTMHLQDVASNGQGVSTLERDEIMKMFGTLLGIDVASYELAVFDGNYFNLEPEEYETLTEEQITPVHVEYFETEEEARKGHERVLAAINAGTLVYSGVPDERR